MLHLCSTIVRYDHNLAGNIDMNTQKTAALLAVYGIFTLLLGVLYMIFIDLSFKLESVTCLLAGALSAAASVFMLRRQGWSFWVGIVVPFVALLVLAWRSLTALFYLLDMVQNDKLGNPYDEGAAFLIVFTAFLVSTFAAFIQVMLARSNARELSN